MSKIKSYFLPFLLILISFISFYRLLRPGYFSMQDDIQIFRLQQFHQCIQDLQIPCRYVPDAGLGYGYPLFNFYSPLPYILGEIFHLIGFSFINSIKIVFILSHVIGVIGMYLFAKHFWGKLGGFISAVLFLLAPYQAIDSFVRGAIAESLAINLIPFLFWSLTQVIISKKLKLAFVLFLFLLLICHNLTSFSFLPILLIYGLILLYQNHQLNFKNIFSTSILFLLGFGMSSFFTIPLFLEKNLVTVNTMTQGYFYYVNHFVTLFQLFISRFWGYGASLWGPVDDMSFSIGQIHWILPTFILCCLFFNKFKNKKFNIFIFLFFFIVFLFSAFLTHNKSTFLWKSLSFMRFYQFPWRFLSVIIFSLSFLSGGIIFIFKQAKVKTILIALITLLTIVLNFNYFKEDIWFPSLTDQQKLSGSNLIEQSGAGLKDYWPNYGSDFPKEFAPKAPNSDQNIKILEFKKSSNKVNVSIESLIQSLVTIPVVYFPNWTLTVDGLNTEYTTSSELGLIQFNLSPGKHQIELNFINTPVRTFANIFSLISLLVCLILLKFKKL